MIFFQYKCDVAKTFSFKLMSKWLSIKSHIDLNGRQNQPSQSGYIVNLVALDLKTEQNWNEAVEPNVILMPKVTIRINFRKMIRNTGKTISHSLRPTRPPPPPPHTHTHKLLTESRSALCDEPITWDRFRSLTDQPWESLNPGTGAPRDLKTPDHVAGVQSCMEQVNNALVHRPTAPFHLPLSTLTLERHWSIKRSNIQITISNV